MSRYITQEKADLIASAYMSNGFKKSEALVSVGYKENYAKSNCAHKVYNNPLVKQSIAKLQANQTLKTSVTVENIVKELDSTIELALAKNDLNTVARCIELKGKTIGAFADKTISIDEQKTCIDESKRKEAEELAKIRLIG